MTDTQSPTAQPTLTECIEWLDREIHHTPEANWKPKAEAVARATLAHLSSHERLAKELERTKGTFLAILHNENRAMSDREARETLMSVYAMARAALTKPSNEGEPK